MGGDHAQLAAAAMHFGLDRAARLAVGMGDVVDLGRVERTAAHQHLAVVAVGGADRFRLDAVLADGFAQQFERRARAGGAAAGIDLLQRHDVGIVPVDRLGDALERELPVGADAAVDVPGHHAERVAGLRGHAPLLRRLRVTSAWIPSEAPIQATTASTNRITLSGVGAVSTLKIW